MTDRKLCIDCRHFDSGDCMKHAVAEADEYTGEAWATGARIAAMDRRDTDPLSCGHDAKFWEAKI